VASRKIYIIFRRVSRCGTPRAKNVDSKSTLHAESVRHIIRSGGIDRAGAVGGKNGYGKEEDGGGYMAVHSASGHGRRQHRETPDQEAVEARGVRNGVSLPPRPGLVQRVSAVPMTHVMG
jgi:hypothetical protein